MCTVVTTLFVNIITTLIKTHENYCMYICKVKVKHSNGLEFPFDILVEVLNLDLITVHFYLDPFNLDF